MNNAEYHTNKALSKSAIDLLIECPAHYKAWLDSVDNEEGTKALDFGGMFHKLTLEPDTFAAEYAVTDLNLATKAGKEFKESLPSGVTICKTPDYEAALQMSAAIHDHPQAKYLFNTYRAEFPLFWQRDGIECKAKPDIISYIHERRFLADLKSTESVNPDAIQRSIARYGYHRQAAWYLDGMERIGKPCDAFIFIFVEKTYPYLVTMCQLDGDALEKGRRECDRAVDTLKICRKTGIYPCYTRDILTISLPKWAA